MRVVSTHPAATEIVYALGIEPAGVSHECDYPPAARDRPAVVDARVDPEAATPELSAQVDRARAGDGLFTVDRDRLASLDPDLIVAQGTCDVCAVDAGHVERALDDLAVDPDVLSTHPHDLDDVLADVRRIGAAVGRPDRAAALVGSLRERVDRVADAVADLAPPERPRVAVLDWLDPVMVAGHWTPGLVETAGGRYDLVDPGVPATPREWAELRAFDPAVLVAAPCGFDLDRAADEAAALAARPGWTDLAAVERGRVHAMDGNHYVNRPGPRLVDTLEALAALVHPDRFEAPPSDVTRPVGAPAPGAGAG